MLRATEKLQLIAPLLCFVKQRSATTVISLSTGVTLIISVTLVTGAILFTWATLSMTPTDISLSTGAIGGWWMWMKGGCEGRVVDVEGGWWM